MLKLTYGIDAESLEDPYVQGVMRANHIFEETLAPGQYLVEIVPALKYVPSWLPGASFKRKAEQWKKEVYAARDHPAAYVEDQMKTTNTSKNMYLSFFTKCEEYQRRNKLDESPADVCKGLATLAYISGANTTSAAMQASLRFLANYPAVQRRAQAELDSVVGEGCVPTFNDIEGLPYINAVIKEVLRCHSVAPLAAPHQLTEDAEYMGYFLPKDTIIFANASAILHDPTIYPEPNVFNPLRWLVETAKGLEPNESIPDPEIAAFGFGRRICPGRHFARSSLLILVSNVLACFNISPLDDTGKAVDRLSEDVTQGGTSYPVLYRISATPRSSKVARMIEELVAQA